MKMKIIEINYIIKNILKYNSMKVLFNIKLKVNIVAQK